MLSFLMGKRRGRRGERKMGGQPSKIDESKRDESKGSNANQPTTSSADISINIAENQQNSLKPTANIENFIEIPNAVSEESSVYCSRIQEERKTQETPTADTTQHPTGKPQTSGNSLQCPSRSDFVESSDKSTDDCRLHNPFDAADLSVIHKPNPNTNLAGFAEGRPESQSADFADPLKTDGFSKCSLNSSTSKADEKEQIHLSQLTNENLSVGIMETIPADGNSSEVKEIGGEGKMKIDSRDPESEIMTSTGSIRSSVTDQEREHELIISRVNSSAAGVNRVADSLAAGPPSAAKSVRDLEKSRKAFFMGLLEETVEEIYPADFKVTSDDTKMLHLLPDKSNSTCQLSNLTSEKSNSSSENSSEIQLVSSSPKDAKSQNTSMSNETSQPDQIHPDKSNLTSDNQFEKSSLNPPNSDAPTTSNSSKFTPKEPQTGEVSEKLVSDGVYFAQAIETSSRPASCEISGISTENLSLTDDEKYSDVIGSHLDDTSVGQTSSDLNNAAHERTAFENNQVHFERDAHGNRANEPIFKRFDSLEPEEQAVFDKYSLIGEFDCEDDESGFFGEPISINENSTDEKITDSGLGNDAELDEVLKTELDEISLDEFEGISIDVVISEVKSEDVKPDEGGNENREIVGNSDGNDVELGEAADGGGERAGEGVLGERPLGTSRPVRSAAPRDEQADGMLSLSNLTVERFPSKLTLSSALSSSSDESIGTKVKKRVRWADTDDGRSLESYDEYSSGDDEYSSGDDGDGFEGVAKVTEDAVTAAANDEEDEDDEDTSEDEEDEESDAEENKTGTDDTFTNSDISVTVEPLQEIAFKDVEDEDNSSEEDEEEEESEEDEEEKEEEMNETEQKTDDEETLVEKLTKLQEELLAKAASLERAQSDLDAAVLEADKTRKKTERLQDELDTLKRRNSELQQQIDENNLSSEERQRLESKILELERELGAVRSDRYRLEDRLSRLEKDRNQEIQMVQQALERALEEQEAREARYQKEFESERTLSSQRELQMLEDFEWKLRETEKNAKKKMESAEAEATKRIQDMEARLVRAEADLERIAELKLSEIELKQLKVTSAEQRRNLRHVTRQYEELQVNEKILQEEVNRLRAALDKEKLSITHLQALHKDELAEKERKLRVKLDVQASQITSEWEDRLRRELAKLKHELENTYREEKIVAVDMAKLLKEQEIQKLKQGWEKKTKELKSEIGEYKQKLEEKDVSYRQEIENAQTSSDRDTLNLRRKMDKLDMEYQSKIEKLQEEHEAEINEVRQECERKIAQVESSYQLQAGTTRTTIELVKQQMTNENQTRIERLQAIHRQQMDEQWETLEAQRRNEVRGLEDRHRAALEQLRKELDEIRKAVTPTGGKQSGRQRTPIPEAAKQLVIDQLNQEATNPYSCGDLVGIETVSMGSDAEKILFAKLQQMTRQANEDKQEIERLKQRLEEKECVKQQPQQQQQQQQQRQQQHPPHPTRRNRKRRN